MASHVLFLDCFLEQGPHFTCIRIIPGQNCELNIPGLHPRPVHQNPWEWDLAICIPRYFLCTWKFENHHLMVIDICN